nr:SH3 domain-containing protein 19 isoform X1 [Misgurnus anguillicaudatus]
MAEARAEEDDERLRETGGARRRVSEHSDRNKPDQRLSSAGPLSSIRAAIKRTSTRPSSQSDHHRDRRRPEITILSVEPLAPNSWFPGASGAFPPAPPPAPPSWSAGSGTVLLPPPSYDQVIKEKTHEQNLHSISSSSSSPLSSQRSTSTISTQTDTNSPDPQSPAARTVRKIPRPPRPSPPPKLTSPPVDPYIDSNRSDQPGDAKHQTRETLCKPEQRDVQTDSNDISGDVPLLDPAPTTMDFTQTTLDFTPEPVKEEPRARPRPRPRSKIALQPLISEEIQDQPMTREVKVQTLVRLRDEGSESVFAGFGDESSTFSSKYLQDLLEVFGSEESNFNDRSQSEEEEKEDATAGDVFFSPVPSEPVELLNRPQPRPRTQKPKPQLPPKPPTLESDVFETGNPTATQNLSKQTSSPPVPAPRPLLNKHKSRSDRSESVSSGHQIKISSSEEKDSEEQVINNHPTSGTPNDKNIRPSVPRYTRPPPPLHRNVSSTSQVNAVSAVTKMTAASVPSLPPRPTGGRLLPLRPPPKKTTKPAGPSSSSPVTANQQPGGRVAKRGPPLPPRPKIGHPLYKIYSRKVHQGSVDTENAEKLHEEPHSHKEEELIVLDDDTSDPQTQPDLLHDFCSTPEVKDEDMKVCSDLWEDSSTDVQQTHSRCVARFAFVGEEDELTFSEGDVISLIEYVNEEWGRGCLKGQIGNFPLSFVKVETEALPRKPASETPAGEMNRGRTLYDFSPESEDELCLKAGDVVCNLEDMDAEWFLGEFGGKRGIVPKNYIQVLPEP